VHVRTPDMRTLSTLAGFALLIFCTTMLQAQHLKSTDPSSCDSSNTFVETSNTFSFVTTTGTGIFCFQNDSTSNWNNLLFQVDPSSEILASSVFCDSPATASGTAFSHCTIGSNSSGYLTSIFFTGGGCELPGAAPDSNSGDPCFPPDSDQQDDYTGIPIFNPANPNLGYLVVDLTPCNNGDNGGGNLHWQ